VKQEYHEYFDREYFECMGPVHRYMEPEFLE
jgi:hypothetical protein